MARRRWVVTADVDGPRVLVGGWRAGDIARMVGARPMWLGSKRRWSLEARYAWDFVAAAEASGAEVTVTGEMPPLPVDPAPVPVIEPEELQLSLFGGGDAA